MLTIKTSATRLPEKQYCFDVLLGEFLGVPFRVEMTAGAMDTRLVLDQGAVIRFPDTFIDIVKDTRFSEVNEVPTTMDYPYDPKQPPLPVICGNTEYGEQSGEIHCGLDVFASAFFMLTRWEEINPAIPDRHGRFPARASLAFQWKFLDRPVVNEYANLLGQMLVRSGWKMPFTPRKTELILSHDVDHPRLWWSASDRLRTIGGSLLKRRKLEETRFWLRQKTDPFDTFDDIMNGAEAAGVISCFNFMGRRSIKSDCYYPLDEPFIMDLIRKINQRGHQIGFHASYESFNNQTDFNRELGSLQTACNQPVICGRQHYLRFSVPETWQIWADAGLQTDSTLGYAEVPGFRCGTCYDYPAFNLKTRKKLQLREQPLIAMDVTLALYQQLRPDEAWDVLMGLKESVAKHQGAFTLLWHNSSLADYFWKDWYPLYQSFIQTF